LNTPESDDVRVSWNPQPPPNRRRWEAAIRSALAPSRLADVEMVQAGDCWRVQSASLRGSETSGDQVPETASVGPEMRRAVTEYLEAMGFPVAW
jgi:hypothetical protein